MAQRFIIIDLYSTVVLLKPCILCSSNPDNLYLHSTVVLLKLELEIDDGYDRGDLHSTVVLLKRKRFLLAFYPQ